MSKAHNDVVLYDEDDNNQDSGISKTVEMKIVEQPEYCEQCDEYKRLDGVRTCPLFEN